MFKRLKIKLKDYGYGDKGISLVETNPQGFDIVNWYIGLTSEFGLDISFSWGYAHIAWLYLEWPRWGGEKDDKLPKLWRYL